VIHENDLVVGTHGRSIWIMDTFSPLREMNATATNEAYLFQPSPATRVRFNMFGDTPLPPEEPTGQNPPDGAILDYYLGVDKSEVELQIKDSKGNLVNRFSSSDRPELLDSTRLPHPTYWIRPPEVLSTRSGHHRFVWNLRYDEPPGAARGYAIAAVKENTPSSPVGPFVAPGKYTIRLTVDGEVLERELQVKLDPRSEINAEGLRMQTELSLECYNWYNRLQSIREAIDEPLAKSSKWKKGIKEALVKLRGEGSPVAGDILYGSIATTALEQETIMGLQEKLLFVLEVLQSADATPTVSAREAVIALAGRAAEMETQAKMLME
jgi:hypothetical protein